MATKRAFSEAIHPSRREQVPAEPRRKKQKPDNLTGKKSFKKAHTTNHLKSQIRSLKRLLEHHDGLPPAVRIEKERALRSAQHDLEQEEKAKKRSDLIGKWHKVRFFERQKATKRLKRARKELQALGEDDVEGRKVVEEKVGECEVEVNYAIYFPLDVEYVPMFAKKKAKLGEEDAGSPEAEVERQADAETWQRVKKCMEEGTLDALRSGKLNEPTPDGEAGEASEASMAVPKKKRKKVEEQYDVHGNRRERRKAAAAKKEAESEDDSEGGFFE